MSMENQIHNYEMAEIMAYAEKPYQDLAVMDSKSDFERTTLRDLANYAGVTVARAHIADLSAQISAFDTNQQYDASQEDSDEADNGLRDKLDCRLEDFIITSAHPKSSNRVINALQREDIRTLKDVLVWGKSRIMDIRNLGDLSLKIIDDSVKAKLDDQGHLWADSLNVGEIAQICSGLDEVSSVVLPISVRSYYFHKHLPVQEILDTPEEKLAFEFRFARRRDDKTGEYIETPDYAKAAKVKEAAKTFAERFNRARARI